MTKRKHQHEDESSRPEVVEPGSNGGGSPTEDELAAGELFTAEAASAGEGGSPAGEALGLSLEELEAELGRTRAEATANLDGWQRTLADFANYKKRVERDQQESHARAAAGILIRFLPVLDDLERALKERPAQAEASWVEGIELVLRKLQSLLEAEGVEVIPAQGAVFDPNLHEAVTHEDSGEHQEGHIIEVIQQGYRLGDRVLRPALVRVAR
ncbi:MAG TPA: nucleotide exchange factor GrpE [Anaerolineales bacterium]|nr:nucleotide exchange factor GrpE [Anaerolineales bacterium]